jgi:hypothetical protein
VRACYTTDRSQARRCIKACENRTTLVEVFGTGEVTGQVKTVVEHPDATPKNWSITFIEGCPVEIMSRLTWQ